MSLKQKTLKGLGWSFASQGAKQVSHFIITAILARLLLPNDFGLIGMATVFTGFVTMINEMGVSGALIQRQDVDDRHYSSVFWLNIAVGFLMMFLMMFASSSIAVFYNRLELRPILMLLSVNFVIASLSIVQQTLFQKQMDFKRLAFAETLSVIIGGCVGIYAALSGKGVWSLVYQMLALTSSNMALLWFLSKWKPRFLLSITAIKDIVHFSANLAGFNIVNYFARNVDYLLIGKFLGAEALGFYTVAYKLMMYPLQNITSVIGRVTFPVFCKIQHDLEQVRTFYLKMLKVISLMTFPLMTGLFVIAPELILVMYGHKWLPVVILVRLFCICGLLQSIFTTGGPIFLSQGRANLIFIYGLLNSILVFFAVLIGLKWDSQGVVIGYTIQQFLWGLFVQLFLVNRLIKLYNIIFFKNLISSISICTLVLCVGFAFKHYFYHYANELNLILNVLVITLTYAISFYSLGEQRLFKTLLVREANV